MSPPADERLWKLVTKLALSARVLPDIVTFQHSIIETIDSLESKYSNQVAASMTPNFQTFREAHAEPHEA